MKKMKRRGLVLGSDDSRKIGLYDISLFIPTERRTCTLFLL